MKRGKSYEWIPLWTDKWLMGSTRFELDPSERSVFLDLMILGAKDDGFIRANEGMGYPHEYLSRVLNISLELLGSAIEKCVQFKKIKALPNGIYYVTNWESYRLSQRHKKRIMSQKGDMPSSKDDPLYVSVSVLINKILSYLNEKTGKHFRKDSDGAISARIGEGATFEQFKQIIDIKVPKWQSRTWPDKKDPSKICQGDDYLRPSTLFSKEHFDEYLNEFPAQRTEVEIGRGDPAKDAEYKVALKYREEWLAAKSDLTLLEYAKQREAKC